MAIIFPANPSLNQEYTFDNVTYIWDGEKWTVNNTATLSDIYVNKSGDTMTGPLVLNADPTTSLGAATKQYADANGGGGGGGGGGSTTPVPQKVAYLREEQPSGTEGGSSIAGWQTRTLNTKVDADGIVTLNNDEFTLAAGTYDIEWSSPNWYGFQNQSKLTDVTNGTTQEMGSSEYEPGYSQTSSFGSTRVKITSNTTYKIEHYSTGARVTTGLGWAASNGEPEVYTQVKITGTPS